MVHGLVERNFAMPHFALANCHNGDTIKSKLCIIYISSSPACIDLRGVKQQGKISRDVWHYHPHLPTTYRCHLICVHIVDSVTQQYQRPLLTTDIPTFCTSPPSPSSYLLAPQRTGLQKSTMFTKLLAFSEGLKHVKGEVRQLLNWIFFLHKYFKRRCIYVFRPVWV